MKNTFTLLFVSLISVSIAFGQCEPNPYYSAPGIYPDSAAGLPPAVATHEYNFVITAIIPADTTVAPFPTFAIDSIGVTEITGLPEGFQALPNSPSGFWHGGSRGCLLITGTATPEQVGVYPLRFTVVGYMGGLGIPFPYEITYYSLTVLDAGTWGMDELSGNGSFGVRIYPNPASGEFSMQCIVAETGSYLLDIYALNNQLVLNRTLFLRQGENTIRMDIPGLNPGIYYGILRHPYKRESSAFKLAIW